MAYQHLNEQRLAKALEKYTAFLAQEQDAPFVSFADSEKRTKTLGEETYKVSSADGVATLSIAIQSIGWKK